MRTPSRSVLATVAALMCFAVVGCSDDAESAPPETLPSRPEVDDLVRLTGCEDVDPYDEEPSDTPIRGGTATAGARCRIGGASVDLFVRAGRDAGSLQSIDDAVGAGIPADCSAWVAVGETWFALADDEDVLDGVADALGGAVREILPASVAASYDAPGC